MTFSSTRRRGVSNLGRRRIPSPQFGRGACRLRSIRQIQMRLLEFMRERLDHVSYERVCSGVGIPHVYEFSATGKRRRKGSKPPSGLPRPAIARWRLFNPLLTPRRTQPAMRCRDRYRGFDHGKRGRQPGAQSVGRGRSVSGRWNSRPYTAGAQVPALEYTEPRTAWGWRTAKTGRDCPDSFRLPPSV
jgi:hypothetical protein